MPVLTTDEFRERARQRLPRLLFDYIDGGSFAEETSVRNRDDFRAITLLQAVMEDTGTLRMDVELLGQPWTMPVGLSPVGLAGMYARRGEVQAARAASAAGVPFCLSTVGICSVEEVARDARPPWYQLYMLKDRGHMAALLQRASAAGCPALVFTVDMPIAGIRHRDLRSGLVGPNSAGLWLRRAIQASVRPAWVWDVMLRGGPHSFGSIASAMPPSARLNDQLGWIGANMDRSVTWRDMDFVRKHWGGPIIIKGVLHPEAALNAAAAGAQAVVVSNHGGRQLDGVRSSVSALPGIVETLDGRIQVYLDSGVRSGIDVLKALALGADACFLGRPWAFALGAGGGRMVSRLLETIRAELFVAMALTGCTDVRQAGRALLDRNDQGSI